MNRSLILTLFAGLAWLGMTLNINAKDWAVYEGKSGPGLGKHIVLLAGDEEYRSEEVMPMLAKILAQRHGFKCTVLFSIDPDTHNIHPNIVSNVPGLSQLATADLVIMLWRFRELPDADMKFFVDYLDSGKPIIALRTSTHAFSYEKNKTSPYARFDWRSKDWAGGFGQQVLGDTWINHHGDHGKQSTRGIIDPDQKSHPVLKGVENIWGPTDVYALAHLPKDAQVLVRGQVLEGMKPADPPLAGPKNDPMVPVVWLRQFKGDSGHVSQVVTTTMGASVDLENEGLRRLLVNACYWTLGLGDKIPSRNNVDFVGEYHPSYFGFNKYKPGVKPSDLE
jgi:hypothetical protein